MIVNNRIKGYELQNDCIVSVDRTTDWHGKKRITHNGGHPGFRTLHIQLPEDDFDIIFLSNKQKRGIKYDSGLRIWIF